MTDQREKMTHDLLEAGWDIVKEELEQNLEPDSGTPNSSDLPRIVSGISAGSVAARRNVTTGAFYRRWPDRRSYVEQLISYILEKEAHGDTYRMSALNAFDEAAARGETVADILRTVATTQLPAMSESALFAFKIYLWTSCGRYPYLRELLQGQYSVNDSALGAKYATMLGLLGWRLRPGVTSEGLAATIGALTEGMAVRAVVDPAVATHDLLANAITSIILSSIDWAGDSQSPAEHLSTLSERRV